MAYRILIWASRLVLAGIFIYTGYIKLESPLQFAGALAGYELFPESVIYPLARYFPWVELALGILLLIGWKLRYVAFAAVGLLFTFLVILSITYLRGIDADCGCFSFGDRITPLSLARDTLILLPALFLAFEKQIRSRLNSGISQ